MQDLDTCPIEQIIEDARDGLPFILIDAPDRENEGDIIVPAQFGTPRIINFMATHARGLICLAITSERAKQLGLSPMSGRHSSAQGTAFTVSIEAREGVTTGISAHDRARSIAVAIDASKGPDDIASPGHVFPLVARDGGVLVRAGHTEAAVDIARLAGLNAAGVICEIMNDDGTMSRLPELIPFAKRHGLKIGTIADLIHYRQRAETLVERVAQCPFTSHHGGPFEMIVYRDRIHGGEHVALVRGDIAPERPTLVRVHQVDLRTDVLSWNSARPDYVGRAIRLAAAEDGPSALVFVRDPDPAAVSARLTAPTSIGPKTARRDYGIGAQILRNLGVGEMVLLSSSTRKLAALEGFGLTVVGRREITPA